ncbi:MAG TPA: zinc ribbon domain-containing protein [Ktedonobacteraceae bacterium]|nr:zinc ribbon domain-containing protein [Ktedonobacteraceae bacterium]
MPQRSQRQRPQKFSKLQDSPEPEGTPYPRKVYNRRVLLWMSIVYGLAWICFFIDPASRAAFSDTASTTVQPGVFGDLAVLGLIGVVGSFLIMDWRGFTSLNGVIRWKSLSPKFRVILGFFYAGFSIFLAAPYLVQAWLALSEDKKLEGERLRHKIAEQEIALGIKPAMEGICRSCKHPLQVEAQYCLHCGTKVAEALKACPKCATVTIEDAQWCPSCGSAF